MNLPSSLSIAALHVLGKAVPDTAHTSDQMAAVTHRHERKIYCGQKRSHNTAQSRSYAAGLVLVDPEINHIAHAVITTGRRNLVKPEADRTELVQTLFGPGNAPHVMEDHAVVYDVTGQAELPRPVAVLDLGYVEHIVRRR